MPQTYSHIAVISIIINYAVGTGILNLPHEFANASIGVAMVLVVAISISSYLLGQYAVDLMTRSFALQRNGNLHYK